LAGAPTILGTLRGGGTVSGNLTIGTGGLLGASSLTSDILAPSGISTGATPGLLTVNGTLTYAGGSNGSGAASRLRFYLTSVHGGATPAIQQYTQGIIVANGLDVTAPSGQITVEPHSINLNNNVNATGAFGTTTSLYDFNPARDYSWTIVDVTGATPIVGFDANKFSVNLANFNNPGGLITPFNFTVSVENGNNLTLNYFAVPIPEPMLLGLAAAGLLVVARRRKA